MCVAWSAAIFGVDAWLLHQRMDRMLPRTDGGTQLPWDVVFAHAGDVIGPDDCFDLNDGARACKAINAAWRAAAPCLTVEIAEKWHEDRATDAGHGTAESAARLLRSYPSVSRLKLVVSSRNKAAQFRSLLQTVGALSALANVRHLTLAPTHDYSVLDFDDDVILALAAAWPGSHQQQRLVVRDATGRTIDALRHLASPTGRQLELRGDRSVIDLGRWTPAQVASLVAVEGIVVKSSLPLLQQHAASIQDFGVEHVIETVDGYNRYYGVRIDAIIGMGSAHLAGLKHVTLLSGLVESINTRQTEALASMLPADLDIDYVVQDQHWNDWDLDKVSRFAVPGRRMYLRSVYRKQLNVVHGWSEVQRGCVRGLTCRQRVRYSSVVSDLLAALPDLEGFGTLELTRTVLTATSPLLARLRWLKVAWLELAHMRHPSVFPAGVGLRRYDDTIGIDYVNPGNALVVDMEDRHGYNGAWTCDTAGEAACTLGRALAAGSSRRPWDGEPRMPEVAIRPPPQLKTVEELGPLLRSVIAPLAAAGVRMFRVISTESTAGALLEIAAAVMGAPPDDGALPALRMLVVVR